MSKGKQLFFSSITNKYLSGNWKTMPTLSGVNGSGDWFGLPSFPYLWIWMEPEVGLLSPARSCEMERKWNWHNLLNKKGEGLYK